MSECDRIIKEKEINSSITTDICATKSRVVALGKSLRSGVSYADNQLVKTHDVIVSTTDLAKDVETNIVAISAVTESGGQATTSGWDDTNDIPYWVIPASGGEGGGVMRVYGHKGIQYNYGCGENTKTYDTDVSNYSRHVKLSNTSNKKPTAECGNESYQTLEWLNSGGQDVWHIQYPSRYTNYDPNMKLLDTVTLTIGLTTGDVTSRPTENFIPTIIGVKRFTRQYKVYQAPNVITGGSVYVSGHSDIRFTRGATSNQIIRTDSTAQPYEYLFSSGSTARATSSFGTVTSTAYQYARITSGATWLTITGSGTSWKLSVTANTTGAQRSATVRITYNQRVQLSSTYGGGLVNLTGYQDFSVIQNA